EVSCTAGITDDGELIRLFPLPYRRLPPDKRFKKYDWIEVCVRKASDARPESYNPDCDSIKILPGHVGTANAWRARKEILSQIIARSLCELRRRERQGGPTLGLFKPGTIRGFSIKEGSAVWTPDQLESLRQPADQIGLFAGRQMPQGELEKIPY